MGKSEDEGTLVEQFDQLQPKNWVWHANEFGQQTLDCGVRSRVQEDKNYIRTLKIRGWTKILAKKTHERPNAPKSKYSSSSPLHP